MTVFLILLFLIVSKLTTIIQALKAENLQENRQKQKRKAYTRLQTKDLIAVINQPIT